MTMNPCDKRGFTLIEVMVTLVILAFGMMASIVGIMATLDHNMINEMRNEAIKIAQEQEEAVRNTPYVNIALISTQPQQIYRQVRKQQVLYNVTCVRTVYGGSVYGITSVQFTVTWNFKKLPQFIYVLQTLVRQT
jgi:type IV pilus assembly protein PilV